MGVFLRRQWRQKPAYPVLLDPSSPFVQGMILCVPFFENLASPDLQNGFIAYSGNILGVVSGGVSSATGSNLGSYGAAQNNVQPRLVSGFSGAFGARLGTASTTYYSSAVRDAGGFNFQWSSNGTEAWSGTSAGASIMALWKDGKWHNTAFSFDSFTAGNALFLCDNLKNTGTYTGKSLWSKGQLLLLQGYSSNTTFANFLYLWNYAVPEAMLRAIIENPWQIFTPARRTLFVDLGAAASLSRGLAYHTKAATIRDAAYRIKTAALRDAVYHVKASTVRDVAFRVLASLSGGTAWAVLGKGILAADLSWKVKADIGRGLSWRVKTVLVRGQSWNVVSDIVLDDAHIPLDRRLLMDADSRIVAVSAASRLIVILAEDRTLSLQ